MSKDSSYITTYEPAMATKAAEMFNAFNELWPGGFGGAVPYTEQRVHDWLDESSAIADLIAIDDEGELSGYCGLYPHWRDKQAAYISILGVTPKAKGKKFGKRLLLEALKRAHEHGITRVDLHTWSGNLEAVPLYKKIGLFWVPETTVYMQDYIPGLLNIPVAKDWFKKYPDWYGTLKRELIQRPDYDVIDGMELYQYKFEDGKDYLIAEVDRYGWGFCSFERMIDEKKILAKSRLNSHKIIMGIPNSLTITLQNDYSDEVSIPFKIEPFEGVEWLNNPPEKIILKKGEATEITLGFIANRKAEPFKDNDQATKTITSTLHFKDLKIKLITSGKIQPAVKIRNNSDIQFKVAAIGEKSKINLDIHNNTEQDISGNVAVAIKGLENQNQIIDFSIKKEEINGLDIPIEIPKDTTN
ncbi:MAG: GNAT family N-acetyltransferase, partial [Asgard group archaeon]|nr:GNAT family N-acetyltransferase [Asgard group archaeon]